MGSWRSSGPRSPTRTTWCAPPTRRCGCTRASAAWPASCVAPRGSTCRSASGSTRARWWCARSAATCTSSTPRSARRRTWPPRWSGSPGPARYRLQAATARGLSRFVGRDDEVTQLRQALDRARAGYGRMVALVGEPGVGKSRVIHEFTEGPWIAGALVLEGRPIAYRRTPSWLPVIEALRRYFQVEPRGDARVIREKIMSKVVALDPALEPTVPALHALADLEPEDPAWGQLDPPQRRRRIQDAVRNLLLAETRRQPVVLIVEDPQRIDEETQTLLDGLVDRLPGTRLLILVAYRPEYQHAWGTRPGYEQIRVDPFPPAAARTLLETLLGPDPDLEPLKALLVARTDGNPLFLEESVRAVLAARIDRLSALAKHVLQSASVIGKDVPLPVLEAIADLPGEPGRR